nr:uncharacterized protein LOC123281373 [Equus asinus]
MHPRGGSPEPTEVSKFGRSPYQLPLSPQDCPWATAHLVCEAPRQMQLPREQPVSDWSYGVGPRGMFVATLCVLPSASRKTRSAECLSLNPDATRAGSGTATPERPQEGAVGTPGHTAPGALNSAQLSVVLSMLLSKAPQSCPAEGPPWALSCPCLGPACPLGGPGRCVGTATLEGSAASLVTLYESVCVYFMPGLSFPITPAPGGQESNAPLLPPNDNGLQPPAISEGRTPVWAAIEE